MKTHFMVVIMVQNLALRATGPKGLHRRNPKRREREALLHFALCGKVSGAKRRKVWCAKRSYRLVGKKLRREAPESMKVCSAKRSHSHVGENCRREALLLTGALEPMQARSAGTYVACMRSCRRINLLTTHTGRIWWRYIRVIFNSG